MTLRRLFGAIALSFCACYSAGNGTAPPDKNFYFPVGLTVSGGGNALYVVNSDFDLQWNGGTLQSYDLHLIRKHAVWVLQNPAHPEKAQPPVPYLQPAPKEDECPARPNYRPDGSGQAQPVGQTCAPQVNSQFYVRDSAIIGAFATDLQLSWEGSRLFTPVRGDATLTWADVGRDFDFGPAGERRPQAPASEDPAVSYPAFHIDCGARVANRCDFAHHAGSDPNEASNTRHLTLPGEPFGMAQSEDGSAIVITHQNDTKVSLLTSGLAPRPVDPAQAASHANAVPPALQFIADGLSNGGTGIVNGGNGVASIPHDPAAFDPCIAPKDGSPCQPQPPRPGFLMTSRTTAEIDLLRYYSDEGVAKSPDQQPVQSTILRPFLLKEAAFPLTVNAGGTDSRGIVIDSTPRIACKLGVRGADASASTPRTDADVNADLIACARLPARVFIANRSPASLLLGEIGEPSLAGDGGYDSDRLVLFGNTPLSFGPSRLYLAPIVDADGTYALRVFIVCFDSATVFVYDPDAGQVENIIHVGAGPFAMAFDPFELNDVAGRKNVPQDAHEPSLDLKAYRFAYVASFTNSFVQVIDLDNSRSDKSSFERIVFTLGSPTSPKGSP